jgi:hypothetical protein
MVRVRTTCLVDSSKDELLPLHDLYQGGLVVGNRDVNTLPIAFSLENGLGTSSEFVGPSHV